MSRSGDEDDESPRAPGWYPDPWSATGTGERYFDGKKWGSSERPLARHTTTAVETRRLPSSAPGKGRVQRAVRPALVIAALFGAGFLLSRFQHHDSHNGTLPIPSTVPARPANHPPASKEEAPAPLGTPAPVPPGPGKYEFLAEQPNAPGQPVAWDPCRPIHYVVNSTSAPPDGPALIHAAITTLAKATGFTFVDDGATTEAPRKGRPAYQPARYGADRWAPVLIAWSDETKYPELAGYIAGIGSPLGLTTTDNRAVYVSGQVVLDRVQLSTTAVRNRAQVEAVILHEFGHLVGLDHTSDRTQLMFSEAERNVLTYGRGDLRGLALLGTQSCFPDV